MPLVNICNQSGSFSGTSLYRDSSPYPQMLDLELILTKTLFISKTVLLQYTIFLTVLK